MSCGVPPVTERQRTRSRPIAMRSAELIMASDLVPERIGAEAVGTLRTGAKSEIDQQD